MEYDNAMYRYVHNLQGDIVAIVDTNGNAVVEYKYDAWGKPIYEADSLSNTLGHLNPFRYRGYVWDTETELFYLRSRYYSSLIDRFVNCDCVFVKYHGLNSLNLFAYCKCNPIVYGDANGMQSYILVAAYTKRKALEDWGHAEIGIMNSNGDIEIYSYGRYADESNEYDLTGPGILVLYEGKDTWESNIDDKGREGIVVALKASDEQIESLRNYFNQKISQGKVYHGSKVGDNPAYHIDEYHIAFNNCTTTTALALKHVYDDEISISILDAIIPAFMFANLATMVSENNPLVAKSYTTWKEFIE